MTPARHRRAPALLVLLMLTAAAAAPLIVAPGARGEPLLPDSASGAGAEDLPSWPEAVLPPVRIAPTSTAPPTPSPDLRKRTQQPERPLLVPNEVPVGDLALHGQLPGNGDAEARPPEPLHYPLAVGALEQNPWGWRYSTARGAWRMHTGLDLIAAEGTAVLAVSGGRVQRVDQISGYGLTVLVDHGDGWSSLYAHLLKASVAEGDTVRAGEPLGAVGQSGNATTPHLHLELRQRQPQGLVAVDPTPLLPSPPGGGAIAGDIRP